MLLYNFTVTSTAYKWHCWHPLEAAHNTGLSPHFVLLNLSKPTPVCPLGGKKGRRKKNLQKTYWLLVVFWQQILLKTTVDNEETDHKFSGKRLLNNISFPMGQPVLAFLSHIFFLLQSSTVWLLQVIIYIKRAKKVWHLLWAIMYLKRLEHTLVGSSPPHIHRIKCQTPKDPRAGHVQEHWLKSSLIFWKRQAKIYLCPVWSKSKNMNWIIKIEHTSIGHWEN